jgi:plasmid stabilization system protein ParE
MLSMTYRVDLTERAARDLRHIYETINADDVVRARAWFNGLEKAILRLDQHPARAPTIPEDHSLRHLLYGRRPNVYRIIFVIDERNRVVTVLHIRHGARNAFGSEAGD